MNVKIISTNTHLHTSLCVGLFLLSIFAYMYFLSLSVVHVVLREEATEKINTLHDEIAYLESEYIEARYRISDEIASLDDFSLTEDKIFIYRGKDSLVLSAQPE